MSERAREPLFFEDVEEEAEPEPATESAGIGGPPTAVGSGLRDDRGDRQRWRSAAIEDLGLSMRAYASFRKSELNTVAEILGKSQDEISFSLEHPSGEPWGRVLLTLESQGNRIQDLDLTGTDLSTLARKVYEELREKLDELGVIPVDADWDSARGVN